MSEKTWREVVTDPQLVLPPESPSRARIEKLLQYFEEKGLTIKNVALRGTICEVLLEDLKPKFYFKVVIPELRRFAEEEQRRITYRFKTFKKFPIRRVSVHLNLWLKDKRPEVVRFPS